MKSDIAPVGWHVPAITEYETIFNFLIENGYNWDGTFTGNKFGKALAATTDWNQSDATEGSIGHDLSKNNRSGFTALPGGGRSENGEFFYLTNFGAWWLSSEWSPTEGCYFGTYSTYTGFDSYCGWGKKQGTSIRCIRDY